MTEAVVVRSLAECEAKVENFVGAWYEAGEALREIQDGLLFMPEYDTFEAYCKGRWNWSYNKAFRQISAANAVRTLPRGNVPRDEYQARALVPLSEDERAEVARRVVFADATAAEVREVARAVHPPKSAEPLRRPRRETSGHEQLVELIRFKLTTLRKEYAIVTYWQPVWDAIDQLNKETTK